VWLLVGVLLVVVSGTLIPMLGNQAEVGFSATPFADAILFEAEAPVARLTIEVFDLSGWPLWSSGEVLGRSMDWDRTAQWGERLTDTAYLYQALGWDDQGVLVLDYSDIVLDPYGTVRGAPYQAADGAYSVALGRRAKADHKGAFVWSDSNDFDFSSTAFDQFSVRATGGVRFITGIDGRGNPRAGVILPPGAGAWSTLSDYNLKENFAPVDGQEVLARLAELPITVWNYKAQDPSIRHMGLVAQDFYASFGLGEANRYISTVDADGVALAAIQGLYELLLEKERELAELRARLESLEREVKVLKD
jgi:hypothetical protein